MLRDLILIPFNFFRRILQSFGFFLEKEEDPPPKKEDDPIKKEVRFIRMYYNPETRETWEAGELIHLD
jgi:hypothetical protein